MYNIDNIERIINSLHHSINHVYVYYLFFLRKLFPMKFPAKEKKKRIDILFFSFFKKISRYLESQLLFLFTTFPRSVYAI